MFKRRKDLLAPKLVERRRKRAISIALISSASFLILLGLIVYILSLPSFRIQRIIAVGNSYVEESNLSAAAEGALGGRYFGIVPRSSSFLYPGRAIENTILENFPWIKDVRASLAGMNALSLVVRERQPYALWCEGAADDDLLPCYFMDNEGYIFGNAPHFSGNVYHKYYGWASSSPITGHYLDPERFKKIDEFVWAAKDLSLALTGTVYNDGDFEIMTEGGGKIVIKESDDYRKTFANLESLVENSSLLRDPKGALNLDYIDLRFGNKIFYKHKES